jgi:pseudaminic acid synthase
MAKTLKIGNRQVGEGQPCFIVAEMSGNHNQNYTTAVRLVKAAAAAGADAIKLQTYTADTMTIDSDKKWFRVGGEKNPESWRGQTLYALYQKASTPWSWFPKLKEIAEGLGLVFFSTPFDQTAVDFLEGLDIPCYKIAAYESVDLALLKKVAATGRPVIVSVGFSTLTEVQLTVDTLKQNGSGDVIVLQCITSYSDKPKISSTNLKTMMDIKKRFDVTVGLSDNVGGIDVPVTAAALGASVLEKHIVLSHADFTFDSRFSLDQEEFSLMVRKIRAMESDLAGKERKRLISSHRAMLGKAAYGPRTAEERYNRNFRRSLFAVLDIKKGERFTEKNVRSIRPGYGLPPEDLYAILGRIAKVNIERGTPLNWTLVSQG